MKTTEFKAVRLTFIWTTLFINASNAHASATPSDFEPCQKIAVSSLDLCLKASAKNTGGKVNDNACWQASKKNYDVCIAKVVKSYNPEEKSERKAIEQEALRKAKAVEADKMKNKDKRQK
jgi:hypothetical protein